MPDSFRQVGDDETGDTAAHFVRRLKIERTKATATYERTGERAALLASKPDIGSVMETILSVDLYVTSVDIDDLEGGSAARMTVCASAEYEETTGELEPLGEPQYTVEFNELRNKIEAHPCCGTLTSSYLDGGSNWDNWQDLEESDWIPSADIPDFYSTIGAWTLEEYLSLKKEGIDEYVMYLPVITRTLYYLGRPSDIGTDSGTIQTPPVGIFADADKYWWLLGPDSFILKGGRGERKTSWTGSPMMSLLLYP